MMIIVYTSAVHVSFARIYRIWFGYMKWKKNKQCESNKYDAYT